MEKPHILIIEDEKNIADALQNALEENGFRTTASYTGENGLKLLLRESFDLLLLDINLNGISGFEVSNRLRQRNASMGIIMLTSLHEYESKELGFKSGADDYLVKPVEFKELLLKVNALLRRVNHHLPSVTILGIGDLEMDIDSKTVRRGETLIALTAKEFRLLEYLLRNKNKVVTRRDIAKHVWDIDFDTATNVIDVYINYLRNKIDRPFASRLIHTQTGIGFVMKEMSN